ncbi:MAG: E3 binding domain-containing protein [Planctomycetota bacterium]
MPELLKLPYLGTAEEDVLFAAWFVAEGKSFQKGETLAVVETLKATFEIEAERDGVLLRRLVEEGQRIPVHTPLGVIGSGGERLDEGELARLLHAVPAAKERGAGPAAAGSAPAPAERRSAPVPAAPAARRKASELGVDLATVAGTGRNGLIRAEDVERAAAARTGGGAADGALAPEFLAHLRSDSAAFAALRAEFKVALYRRHGAIVGPGTRLGANAVLLVERLVLGKDCVLADGVRVEAREFVAGDLLYLGPRSRVRCTKVSFGDNAYLAEDVEIGGGGAMDPEAELQVGSHGFIGEHVHLNPCRPIVVGDEVVISRSAVLMTHSFGASILKGYPNRFAGIRLGDCCQVGIHATLFPGVEMGEGSILLSGSSLVSAIPPGRLFGGVPARDLKAAATPLSEEAFLQVAKDLVAEFARQMERRGRVVVRTEAGGETRITIRDAEALHQLRFAVSALPAAAEGLAEEVRIYLRPAAGEWDGLPADVAGIDLAAAAVKGPAGPLGDAVREFLRKRGVRLRPRSWTYRGGWL